MTLCGPSRLGEVILTGGGRRKQFPLVYALMSHRRTIDNIRIFNELKVAMEERGLQLAPSAFMLARPNESYQVIPDFYAHAENGVRAVEGAGLIPARLFCWDVG